MISLEEKIKQTDLFTSEEKEGILSHLSLLSDTQKKILERVIDDYNNKHTELVQRFKKDTFTDLRNLEEQNAHDKNTSIQTAITSIEQGLNTIVPTM